MLFSQWDFWCKSRMKLGKEPHVACGTQVGHTSAIYSLFSMSAQNENEPVFECILTWYSKLQALLLKCTKFE